MTQQIRTVLSREPEKMTPRTMVKSSLFPFRPLLLSVLWMLAGCIQVCLGQTKSLETEIVPASLAVSPAGTATQFVFILRNPGDAEVRQLRYLGLSMKVSALIRLNRSRLLQSVRT